MKRYKILNIAGAASAVGLAVLPAFFSIAPAFRIQSAHAETTENLGTAATIYSTLGLSANSINMSISPSSTGAVFKTGKTVATVSTNNETGYTLYLSDSDSDNALKHANLTDAAISSIATNTAGTNMAVNTWGYTLGESVVEGENETDNDTNLALTYSPIPTVRTVIKKTDNAVSTEATAVTFGVKVNTEIPSGVYSDQVAITAVPNYNSAAYEGKTLWLNSEGVQISTMQEMTHDVCASVPTPTAHKSDGTINASVPEITLTDTRDNEIYTVRKLADGNCWMIEYLRINNKTLTPDDSDVTEEVVLPEAVTSTTGLTGSFTQPIVVYSESRDQYSYNYHAAGAYTAGVSTKINDEPNHSARAKGWRMSDTHDRSYVKLLADTYRIVSMDENGRFRYVSPYNYATLKTAPFDMAIVNTSSDEIRVWVSGTESTWTSGGYRIVLRSWQALLPPHKENSDNKSNSYYPVSCVAL